MPDPGRVIQGTVVPAWLTSKSLGLSERRCNSQHPLRRSTKIPENPTDAGPAAERSNLLTLNLLESRPYLDLLLGQWISSGQWGRIPSCLPHRLQLTHYPL